MTTRPVLLRALAVAALAIAMLGLTALKSEAAPFGAVISDQQMKLLASDGATSDWFGHSVAIDGDTALVGAPFDDGSVGDQGAAYVYTRSGTSWAQQQKLTATDAAFGDRFGTSVAIAGDVAFIGAPFKSPAGAPNRGSAYVFVRAGSTWTQHQQLIASDATGGETFGFAVDISGDTAIIGAPSDTGPGGSSQGSSYVFTRSDTTWVEEQRLVAADGASYDSFGADVAIDGVNALVGAPSGDGTEFGQGTAYFFSRSDGSWTERQELLAAGGASGDSFGFSLAIEGDTALIGAPRDDDGHGGSHGQGSTFVFGRSGSTWTELQHLRASDPSGDDQFGWSVAISGDTAVISAQYDDGVTGSDQGSAYIFERATTWTQQHELVAPDAAHADLFGHAAAISGDTAIVGAYADNGSGGTDQGGAYVFVPGSFGVSNATVTEGTGGTANATFTITRSGTTAIQAYVNVSTVADSAIAGVDFQRVSTTVSFAPGAASRTVTVPVLGDALDEDTEAFSVELSAPVGALIGDGSGLGTILDDDDASSIAISAPAAVTETDASQVAVNFTISRAGSSGGAVTVEARTVNGTAAAPDDFDHVVRTIRWASGETGNKTFAVMVDPDDLTEGVERFYAKLFNVTGPADITVGSARATINDDDPATLSISVNSPTIVEADSGTKNIVFKVTRTGSTASAITFNYATANGTAVAPGDYTAKTGTATIAAGATFVNVAVVTKGETIAEGNENFTLTISNPTGGATIGTATGTGTITNDD